MRLFRVLSLLLAVGTAAGVSVAFPEEKCPATPADELGPFYREGAPLRDTIGSGYLLSGTVRGAGNCRPIPGARVEFWQVGPSGAYDDAHRAQVIADGKGRYRLVTDFPPPYAGRPPHIHILASARGFGTLVTQHYPRKGGRAASFDLVLEPR